ncbi:MAG: acrR [Solirubrobacterales bacterium]|nr:acrR [Solirubrobacterales bacterium]
MASTENETRTPETRESQPPRWKRLAGDERRRQIIGVARGLFAERAYSDVSTTDIARAAGVTHGLLTYHFGSKRNLYLAVLRSTLIVPKAPGPVDVTDPDLDSALDEMTEWWLTQLESNPELWLAVLGARGMGRDPDVEALLDGIEERARGDLVAYLTARDPAEAPPELWALVAGWQGLAEATGVEWLKGGRINRAQAKVIILESLRQLLKLQTMVRRAGEAPPARGAKRGRS